MMSVSFFMAYRSFWKFWQASTPATIRRLLKPRHPDSRIARTAAAQALKHGYAELYKHSEYVHAMDDNEIEGLIVQVTGSAANARNVKLTLNCFKNLREYAHFNSGEATSVEIQQEVVA